MDKDKKLFLGVIVLLLIFMVFVGILAFKDKKEETKKEAETTEAMNFKMEYETLNNKVNTNNGKQYKSLNISNNNPVDYASEEEIISILEQKTGIIYLGFPTCPWCRSMLPVLLQTMDNMNIDKLYYLNILEMRDTFELDDKGHAEKVKDGTEGYYKMLEILDDFLEPFYLTNEKGKEIDTKEKRIYAPTVIGVKNGRVVGIHVSTVDSQKDPYEALTKEQEEELSSIFIELINKVYDVDCDEAC